MARTITFSCKLEIESPGFSLMIKKKNELEMKGGMPSVRRSVCAAMLLDEYAELLKVHEELLKQLNDGRK